MKCLATGTMQEASGCLYEGTYLREFLPMVTFSFRAKMIVFCPNRPTQTTNVTHARDQGTTPIELLALLLLAAPAVVTLQKFVSLPEFGDESHQFAEPPPRMILIQNATAVLLFQFIKPALIRLHPRFYVSFLIDEIPGPFFQDRITDWKNFA